MRSSKFGSFVLSDIFKEAKSPIGLADKISSSCAARLGRAEDFFSFLTGPPGGTYQRASRCADLNSARYVRSLARGRAIGPRAVRLRLLACEFIILAAPDVSRALMRSLLHRCLT